MYRKSILIKRGRPAGTSGESSGVRAHGDEEFPQEMKQKDEMRKVQSLASPQVRAVTARVVNGNNYAAGARTLTLPFPPTSMLCGIMHLQKSLKSHT